MKIADTQGGPTIVITVYTTLRCVLNSPTTNCSCQLVDRLNISTFTKNYLPNMLII